MSPKAVGPSAKPKFPELDMNRVLLHIALVVEARKFIMIEEPSKAEGSLEFFAAKLEDSEIPLQVLKYWESLGQAQPISQISLSKVRQYASCRLL